MLDRKAAQHVTNKTAPSNCFLCGARLYEINEISNLELQYTLHLGYNLEFQYWRTTKTTLSIKETAKEHIQKR